MADEAKRDNEARAHEVVRDCVLEIIPPELVQAFQLVAELDFPVNDAPALQASLDEGGEGGQLLRLLRPTDFPLSGARNALDKLSARIAQWAEIPSKEDFRGPRIPDPGEFPEHVAPGRSMEEIYQAMFWPHCADVAYAKYLEERGNGESQRGAERAGEAAGENCEKLRKSILESLNLRPRRPSIPSRFRFPPP